MMSATQYVVIVGVCIIMAIISFWMFTAARKKRKRAEWMVHDMVDGTVTPVRATPGGRLFRDIAIRNTCPDCGGKGFWAGPCGGMSQNVYCMNAKCRSAFNVTQLSEDTGSVERIGKAPDRIYDKPTPPEAA